MPVTFHKALKQLLPFFAVLVLSTPVCSREQPDLLRRPVAGFQADRLSRIEAVLKLGKEQKLPLGIEYVGPELFEPVRVHHGRTELRTVLGTLFPKEIGFEVYVQGRVLIISHRDVPRGAGNLLDRPLRELSIPESTAPEAGLLVQMELTRELESSPQGWAGSFHRGTGKVRVGPFKLEKATIRDALNRIVSEHGNAAWVVQVRPALLGRMQSGGLWIVAEYDDLSETFGKSLKERVGILR